MNPLEEERHGISRWVREQVDSMIENLGDDDESIKFARRAYKQSIERPQVAWLADRISRGAPVTLFQMFEEARPRWYPWVGMTDVSPEADGGTTYTNREAAWKAFTKDYEYARVFLALVRPKLAPEMEAAAHVAVVERYDDVSRMSVRALELQLAEIEREPGRAREGVQNFTKLLHAFRDVTKDLASLVGKPVVDSIKVQGQVDHRHAHLHAQVPGQPVGTSTAYGDWAAPQPNDLTVAVNVPPELPERSDEDEVPGEFVETGVLEYREVTI